MNSFTNKSFLKLLDFTPEQIDSLLCLAAELKARFEHDENQRRLAELREHTEQLEALSRRLERLQEPQEEYLLGLEKQVRALQQALKELGFLSGSVDGVYGSMTAKECWEKVIALKPFGE